MRKLKTIGESLIGIGIIIGITTCVVALGASPTKGLPIVVELAQAGKSVIYRLHDVETGVDCYVIPQDHCSGDCAYSPAVACVK